MRIITSTLFGVLAASCNLLANPPALKSVQDPSGRLVQIPARIERAVCIGSGCLRIVSYLKATDRIVGVEQQEKREKQNGTRTYLIANPKLTKRPSIGPGTKGDAELIMQVAPQVILWANGAPDALERMAQKTQLPIISFNPGNFAADSAQFFRSLRFMGQILGLAARADTVAQYLHSQLAELDSLREKLPRPLSAYAGGLAYQGCHGIATTHPDFTPFYLLGIHNVAQQAPHTGNNPVQIDLENLLAWNPSLLVVDEACRESVEADFGKFSFLNSWRSRLVWTWPSNSYGENWETTLANTFKIAFHLTRQGNALAKRQEINRIFLGIQQPLPFITEAPLATNP